MDYRHERTRSDSSPRAAGSAQIGPAGPGCGTLCKLSGGPPRHDRSERRPDPLLDTVIQDVGLGQTAS